MLLQETDLLTQRISGIINSGYLEEKTEKQD